MSRPMAEQVLDDQRALAVETDVAAQVVVNPRIGERTEEDDERQCGPQQLGTEDRDPVGEVERL
jgi:hypothetical protein